MNLVQITPGAGGMYCGNCFRDNALVAALRQQGHSTLMIPLYLPMTLDEEDQSTGTPIFFSGVNVYLEQQSSFFRNAPNWLHKLLASPRLLKWASGRAAKTRAEDVGELTISMLRGEEGNQARELDELIAWLKPQPKPDAICLSNAMLVGLARKLKQELGSPIVCMLQGEDAFLDAMTSPTREEVWKTLADRCKDVDLFLAPSRYFGDLMTRRLGLPKEKVHVLFNGINLDGYDKTVIPPSPNHPPVIGYFARMCKDKGLDTLVEAFLLLKQRNRVPLLKLRVGGGCGPTDEPFVQQLKERIQRAGHLSSVEFRPNVTREEKLQFYRGLNVFSVPAVYGEAFGLYVIESLAAGVPVVQPRTASFPELVEATGGGALFEPGKAEALADTIEKLLLEDDLRRDLAQAGHHSVHSRFGIDHMATELAGLFERSLPRR
ncbi:MAG TPA: glycosyltransferase family 4 protein [Roseimicrobium sp.]|nr:glycosyltransferase family 4 protein [Roseimicrobium sp.]